jgi:hypothetical protein
MIRFFLTGLIKLPLFLLLYWAVFNQYAPSDVVHFYWLRKPEVIMLVAGGTGLFLLKRIIWIHAFARPKRYFLRYLFTLILIPSYAFISLFIVFVLNGYLDDHSRQEAWETNLVFYKDAKVACFSAGLDDDYLIPGVRQDPEVIFVSKSQCGKIGPEVENATQPYPYLITLSNGKFGIPYVSNIEINPHILPH